MQLIAFTLLPPRTFAQSFIKRDPEHTLSWSLEARYCPSMDLIATFARLDLPEIDQTPASDRNQDDQPGTEAVDDHDDDDDEEPLTVDVWRLNGQKVFSVSAEGTRRPPSIVDAAWRNDGRTLAILTSDYMVRLVNSFTGKIVNRFSTGSSFPISHSPSLIRQSPRQSRRSSNRLSRSVRGKPTCLSYATHFSDPQLMSERLAAASQEKGLLLDDLLGLNADIDLLLKTKADLPRELSSIDVEASIPRLSCLPPLGIGAEDLFSTRASIDTIFHSSQRNVRGGVVDVLTSGSTNGHVHLRLFDSFEIGEIDLKSAIGLSKQAHCGRILAIADHPLRSESFVAVEDGMAAGTSQTAYLFCLEVKSMRQNTMSLPTVAWKVAQLENIVRYLTQVQQQLAREVKAAFDLPFRFLRNLNEDLVAQDGEGASFVTTAYHAGVTGEVSGAFREWLAEQIGERGTKRWEKSVGDCLELVRRLVSDSWNPAVERAAVVISRLSGFAQHPLTGGISEGGLYIDRKIVDDLRQTVDVMAIRGEDLIQDVIEELNGFTCFMKWLKWEVEAAGLEDTSEKLDEMREQRDYDDVLTVLDYIQRNPADTEIKHYIGDPYSNETVALGKENTPFYSNFKTQRQRTPRDVKLPSFSDLLGRIKTQCRSFSEQIARGLKNSVLVEFVEQMPQAMDLDHMSMKAISASNGDLFQCHTISRHKKHGAAIFYTRTTRRTRGTPDPTDTNHVHRVLDIQDVTTVLDLKFVDDYTFMVLAVKGPDACLLSHNIDDAAAGETAWELRHVFEGYKMEAGMRPARLEINGRKGRRAVLVVDEYHRGYSVFDLDSGDALEDDAGSGDAVMVE